MKIDLKMEKDVRPKALLWGVGSKTRGTVSREPEGGPAEVLQENKYTEHALGPCECAKAAHSCANRSRLPWSDCWAYKVHERLVDPYPLANSRHSVMFILSPFTSESAEAITGLSEPGELLSTSISQRNYEVLLSTATGREFQISPDSWPATIDHPLGKEREGRVAS